MMEFYSTACILIMFPLLLINDNQIFRKNTVDCFNKICLKYIIQNNLKQECFEGWFLIQGQTWKWVTLPGINLNEYGI